MDYGRLLMFMIAATAAMASVTHLWCWAYLSLERMVILRKLSGLFLELDQERLEDDEIERRRLLAPRYMTWEQAMADFRGGVPIDDVLDRLNGEFPPRASEIQHGSPLPPPGSLGTSISGPAVAAVFGIVAIYMCLFGIGIKPAGMEFLIQKAREQFGGDPKSSAAGGQGVSTGLSDLGGSAGLNCDGGAKTFNGR